MSRKAEHSRHADQKASNGGNYGDGGNRTRATFPARTSTLNMLADRVYLALELMSDVGAASLDLHVAAGKPGSKTLAFNAGEPAHLTFRRRYNGCCTDASRRIVIMEGLAEIRALRYARHPTVDCQTLEGRLTVGRDTRPADVVAHAYGYSLGHVYRLREEARRYDQRHGKRAA